jgi:tRNA-splicing ligase RtcB
MKTTQKEGSRPVHVWTDNVEESAQKQLDNLAQLPFLHPHGLAVMPDVHTGIGSTVGTVIATEKAIIPAAVGVDIGCFRADTRVPLLDGTQATLLDLSQRTDPFWVYSIDSELGVAPGLARCLKTRKNAELMRVVVSGGEEIICTPDQRFMLNDGFYKEAKDLKFNDSLMPLYRRWQTRDGYESVNNGKGRSVQTHIMVWEASHGRAVPSDHVVHHSNHIHFDNRPCNLELMEQSAHSAYHRKVGHSLDNADPSFQQLRRAGIARRSADPEKRLQMVAVGTANITKYMAQRPEHFKTSVAGNGVRGAPHLRRFNKSARTCDVCDAEAKNPASLRWHKQREHGFNHKVILAEVLADRADVYCLQVEGHNNFALAAGVFVHNCGMNAVRVSLKASDLPDSLAGLRHDIERSVPLGAGGAHRHDKDLPVAPPASVLAASPAKNAGRQLGTLGSGNHFIEICVDENEDVWVVLHSGSRGIGNQIGRYYIERAKKLMERRFIALPDRDLAYLPEDTDDFRDYVEAVHWAQEYALENRRRMMAAVLNTMRHRIKKPFQVTQEAINCHHNYVEIENHFGQDVYVTRKGAIRARAGDLGVIPGSMGTRSYIVRGKGNPASYCSCSHGAGRRMSRAAARKAFTVSDLRAQTQGVECRKDADVLDEIPGAYKDLDVVMENQRDLVEVVHTLKQVVCVKGS